MAKLKVSETFCHYIGASPVAVPCQGLELGFSCSVKLLDHTVPPEALKNNKPFMMPFLRKGEYWGVGNTGCDLTLSSATHHKANDKSSHTTVAAWICLEEIRNNCQCGQI